MTDVTIFKEGGGGQDNFYSVMKRCYWGGRVDKLLKKQAAKVFRIDRNIPESS